MKEVEINRCLQKNEIKFNLTKNDNLKKKELKHNI